MKNRTIFTADNLDVLRGIDSQSVDLIYLDPPFNSKRDYSAPIGSEAAGAAFKDTWTLSDVDLAWHGEIAERSPALYQTVGAAGLSHGKSMQSYLIMMAVRMLEMQRILAPTGSIYLHVDPTASHYLKALMDCIFGRERFRREVVWNIAVLSGFKTKARNYIRGHDTILFYTQGPSYTWNRPTQPHRQEYIDRFNKTDSEGRKYFDGRGKRRYLDEVIAAGKPVGDVWSDVMSFQQIPTSREKVGYPTQKPLALLERIIRASSNEGDTVLDPFCGCATTCVAAEKLGRRWIGIDLSEKAIQLVRTRLERDCGGLVCDVIHRTDIPRRTDLGKLPSYKTHKHTLFGAQEGRCAGCDVVFPFRNMTIDHVIPRAKGGSDHISNLQILCGACNSAKGKGSQEALIAKLISQGVRA